MKIVYSHCMFGKYYNMLHTVLKCFQSIFPNNWEFRLHVDREDFDNPDWGLIKKYRDNNLINIVVVNEEPKYTKAMLWRLLPLWDDSVEYTFSRDLDSLPILKDRQACQEFINSGLSLHGINDNPSHSIPLMGGMTGFKNIRLKPFIGNNLNELINRFGFENANWQQHGKDQDFLNSCFWSAFKNSSMIHSSANIDYGGNYNRRNSFPEFDFADINPCVKIANSFTNYLGAAGPNKTLEFIEEFYDQCPNDKVSLMNKIKKDHNGNR